MARTILLADDSVTIQKVVEIAFLDEDFRVVAFGNGTDAIGRLAEVQPDIVLADVHMPGADGYEVCAAAREALPGVPVMLLVGTFEVFDADRAREAGAASHLKKPFDSQELLRQVKDLVSASGGGEAAVETAPEPREAEEEAPSWSFSPAAEESPAEPDEPASWSFEPESAPAGETAPEAEEEGEAASELAGEEVAAEWEPVAEPEPLEASEVLEDGAASDEEPGAESAVAAAAEEPFEPEASVEELTAAPVGIGSLSEADVERIAQRVVELLGEKAVRDVAWEVVPDLAEVLLKARIRELEASVE